MSDASRWIFASVFASVSLVVPRPVDDDAFFFAAIVLPQWRSVSCSPRFFFEDGGGAFLGFVGFLGGDFFAAGAAAFFSASAGGGGAPPPPSSSSPSTFTKFGSAL